MRNWNLRIILLTLVFVANIFFPKVSLAQGPTGAPPAKLQDLEGIFAKFAGYLLPTAAVIFFFVVVMGGFKYLTSMGDIKAVSNAHQTLTYGLGGLLVVALAYLILVIIKNLTGANILDFKVFQP